MAKLKIDGEKNFKIFSAITMSVVTLLAFLPFVLIFIASFTDETTLIRYGYSFFPKKLSIDAYLYMVSHAAIITRAYGISILVTVVGTALSVMITAMFAYPMSRRDYKYHNVFAFIAFFTMLFNGGIVPTYMMWTRIFSIRDTIAALIIPTYLMSALNVLLVRNYFNNNVPGAMIEAAKIDGASEFGIFLKIMLPLSIPVIATVGLITGLSYWNDWINALYYINKPQLFGIQNLLLRLMNNIEFLKSGEASTMLGTNVVNLPGTAIRMSLAIVGMLPIIIIFPFLQKYLTKGMVVGAVKG